MHPASIYRNYIDTTGRNKKNQYQDNPFHNQALDNSSYFIQRVMQANRYLLKKRKATLREQVRYLKGHGVKTYRSSIWRWENGIHKTISLCVLFYFCQYHNKSIFEMYWIGEELAEGKEPW